MSSTDSDSSVGDDFWIDEQDVNKRLQKMKQPSTGVAQEDDDIIPKSADLRKEVSYFARDFMPDLRDIENEDDEDNDEDIEEAEIRKKESIQFSVKAGKKYGGDYQEIEKTLYQWAKQLDDDSWIYESS